MGNQRIMWKCKVCGAEYDADPISHEEEGDFLRCHQCHSDRLQRYEHCKCCDEWKPVKENFWLLIDRVCTDCINKDVAAYNAALETLPAGAYDRLCEIYGDLRLDMRVEREE